VIVDEIFTRNTDIEGIPDFPNDGVPEDHPISISSNQEISADAETTLSSEISTTDPLVAASVAYTKACSAHAQAQRDVARRRRLLVRERGRTGLRGRLDAEGRLDHGHLGELGGPRGLRRGGES